MVYTRYVKGFPKNKTKSEILNYEKDSYNGDDP